MNVKSPGNSSNPVPIQSVSPDIKDGTSNTMQVAESSKPKNPFAKDSFEIGVVPGGINGVLDGSSKDATYGSETSGLKADLDRQSSHGRGSVIEDVNVKYTFMDYTDDAD